MTRFRSFNNNTCKRVLNLLELGYLKLREVAVKRITIVKFGVNEEDSHSYGCFGIELYADKPTADLEMQFFFSEDVITVVVHKRMPISTHNEAVLRACAAR